MLVEDIPDRLGHNQDCLMLARNWAPRASDRRLTQKRPRAKSGEPNGGGPRGGEPRAGNRKEAKSEEPRAIRRRTGCSALRSTLSALRSLFSSPLFGSPL